MGGELWRGKKKRWIQIEMQRPTVIMCKRGVRGQNFRNTTRWFLLKKFTVDSTCPCICSQKPIAASGFSHLGDYVFSPIHRRRSVMKKDVTCFKLLPKAGHDVSLRAEIKTLHHTKLRSLYKSRYEARIKDNKNLFF